MEPFSSNNLQAKIESLETRLADAEHLIDAIKAGEVDAFAIQRENTHEVYTLQSGDYAYRVLVERFSEGALNLTEEGLIVYTNNSFCKLINKPYERVVGTSIFEYIAPENKETFNTLFSKSLSGKSKGEVKIGMNGAFCPTYISLTSLQPTLATIGMIVTDLTEKKSNERIIHGYQGELELKNRMLANKNKNLEQQILNEFSESFSAYKTGNEFFDSLTLTLADKTQLSYAFIGEIIQGKQDKILLRSLSLVKEGKLGENFQYPVRQGPGEEIHNDAISSFPEGCQTQFPSHSLIQKYDVEGYIGCPLYDTHKQPIGVIALMHKQKIEDLPYIESLLKIAAKRTEMEMERIRNEHVLAAKNAELQDQNEELASFSYIASHDLQEPLRKIQAFSSRILEKESQQLSDSGKDYFVRISDAASRMQKLIEALLNYSRTNTTEIKLEPTDLNEILADVQKDLQEMIHEKNVIVESEKLPTVNVVTLQFQQLFSNILSNAVKYSKPDIPAHIKIETDIVSGIDIAPDIPSAQSFWKISIADNGIGFDPQHEQRVFELFQRLHGKKEYEGTGIGLAICKKIMNNHKGFITAEGTPGVGAVFNVFLPLTIQ